MCVERMESRPGFRLVYVERVFSQGPMHDPIKDFVTGCPLPCPDHRDNKPAPHHEAMIKARAILKFPPRLHADATRP